MVEDSIADHAITTVKLSKNIGVTQAAAVVPTGTTATLDFDEGNAQLLNLGSASGNVVLTLSNPLVGSTYTILITQGAVARTLTWPALVKWPQNVDPILSTANGAVDMVSLYYNGTDYKGLWEVDLS